MTGSVHVYLDEKYADQAAPTKFQATTLTGAYLASDQIVPFRKRYFALLQRLFPSPANHVPRLPEVHACKLFPERSDAVRFQLMEGLVSIVNDMGLRIGRVGYRRNNGAESIFRRDRDAYRGSYSNFEREFLIPACFMFGFRPSEADPLLHYFMERDESKLQYFLFQGNAVTNQWASEFLPAEAMTVDYSKVGDVSFYAKNLPGGVLPDCMGYLLHLRWRREEGDCLSPFSLRMAEICDALTRDLVAEQIVGLKGT